MQEKQAGHNYKYFHIVCMFFITSLLIADAISVKIISINVLNVPAGIIVFPFAFIFGDILTEVYGFTLTKSIIWWGFICQAIMSLFFLAAVYLPPADFWPHQEGFSTLFGFVPRIVIAGFIAYLIGEFINSIVLSRLKIITKGKHFWIRAIGSTVVGQGIDSILFTFIAFAGVVGLKDMMTMMVSGYVLKVIYEIIVFPVTYKFTNWLKTAEGIDTYDYNVNYNPFT